MRLCAISVDLDEIPNYWAIHGLDPAQGSGRGLSAVYDVAVGRLLDLAEEERIPLTLFAIGSDLARTENAETLRAAHVRGHEIANHTLDHRYDLTRLGHDDMAHQIEGGIAAIVALAGVPWSDPARCTGHDVSVLQVHGDADKVIDYAGGNSFGNGVPYPSAESAVAAWAARDGCGQTRHSAGPPLDFDGAVPGAETTREAYDCPQHLAVELWRMRGSSHVPRFDARFANAALDFLLAHRAERR